LYLAVHVAAKGNVYFGRESHRQVEKRWRLFLSISHNVLAILNQPESAACGVWIKSNVVQFLSHPSFAPTPAQAAGNLKWCTTSEGTLLVLAFLTVHRRVAQREAQAPPSPGALNCLLPHCTAAVLNNTAAVHIYTQFTSLRPQRVPY
jgi:hypothetical protein